MYNTTLFLRIFAVIFGLLGAPTAFLTGGFTFELLCVLIGSLIISIPIFFFVTIFGNSLGNFLLGVGQKVPNNERFKSDLLKAKHALSTEQLDIASDLVTTVLEGSPDHPEALLIKGKIALQAGKEEEGREVLEHLLRVVDRNDVHRKWALNYLRDLNQVMSRK